MVLTQVNEIVAAYRETAVYPNPVSAEIIPSADGLTSVINTVWTERDIERNENVKFSRSYCLTNKQPDGIYKNVVSTRPTEVKNETWNKLSTSRKLRAIVRETKTKSGEEKQFIEIWDHRKKLKTIDVTLQDKHGDIHKNDGFGSFEWSYAGDRLLYIAEKKIPKSVSYFSTKPMSDEERSKVTQGEEFVFRESWGEQMTKYHHPVLCTLDWRAGDITVLESVPDDLSAGQTVWAPNDEGIVFVGWDSGPWRLGRIYCRQRKSHIYLLDLVNNTLKKLSADGWSTRCPVFSPDKSKLIFLEEQTNYTHYQCSRLTKIEWVNKESSVIVEVKADSTNEFSGLFVNQILSGCWCTDNNRIVVSSACRSLIHLYVINVANKTVTRMTTDETVGAWEVQDVSGDMIIAECSSLNTPPYLVVSRIPPPGQESSIRWQRLDESVSKFTDIQWKIQQHEPSENNKNSNYPRVTYETVLITPTGSNSLLPLVVYPHVNYRGSVGFGQDGISSLLGRIGEQDVKDVQSAVESVMRTESIDKQKVVVIGGSHGGFLTTHLIGQYPGFYKAAVARNPVINLASMLGSTDIPDWVFTECGLEFDFAQTPNPELYNTFWSRSPIRYAHQVTTPTMIVLGAEDRRVPSKQGEEFYRALKARGVPVRFLMYPEDCHPIIKIDSESDAFVNIVRWFNEHI